MSSQSVLDALKKDIKTKVEIIFHQNIFYQENGIFGKISSTFQLKNTAIISLTTVNTKRWLY